MDESEIPTVELSKDEESIRAVESWFLDTALEDVRKVIEAEANYVAALALVSYTEVLGGLKTGNLGDKFKSKEHFNEGLALMAWDGSLTYYSDFRAKRCKKTKADNEVGDCPDIYEIARCGLVHQYFMKSLGCVHNNSDSVDHYVDNDKGVGWHDEQLRFHTNAYYRDLKAAAEELFGNAITDPDVAAPIVRAWKWIQSEAGALRPLDKQT